ncbi:hypothetical protein D3C75_503480 [compost metagenome]
MTLDQAVEYVKDVAKSLGYKTFELDLMIPDLREMLYALPTTDKDDVDQLIEDLL